MIKSNNKFKTLTGKVLGGHDPEDCVDQSVTIDVDVVNTVDCKSKFIVTFESDVGLKKAEIISDILLNQAKNLLELDEEFLKKEAHCYILGFIPGDGL